MKTLLAGIARDTGLLQPTNEIGWKVMRKTLFGNLDHIVMNHASIASPMRVGHEYYPGSSTPDQVVYEAVDCARQRLATLMSADPSHIFFEYNTTSAFRFVLRSINVPRNTPVISSLEEYGSMMGVIGEHFTASPKVQVPIDHLEAAISQSIFKNAIVFLSHISRQTGREFPVRDVVKLAKSRGYTVIVDGAQALGHIPVDISFIDPDAYVACGHKWLCARTVSGIAYVKNPVLDENPAIMLASNAYLPSVLRRDKSDDECANIDGLMHLSEVLGVYEAIGEDYWNQRIAHIGSYARNLIQNNNHFLIQHVRDNSPGMLYLKPTSSAVEVGHVATWLERQFKICVTDLGSVMRLSFSPFNLVLDANILNEALVEYGSPSRSGMKDVSTADCFRLF